MLITREVNLKMYKVYNPGIKRICTGKTTESVISGLQDLWEEEQNISIRKTEDIQGNKTILQITIVRIWYTFIPPQNALATYTLQVLMYQCKLPYSNKHATVVGDAGTKCV